jgi:CBS domain-containing protein
MNTVGDAMTPQPVSVTPSDSLQYAARLMDELNVGALPVCEGGELVGIVTDRDITVRATAAGLSPMTTAIDLVMTERVRTCSTEHSTAEALALMSTVQIRRLAVLDGGQRLVGMVSLGDIAEQQHDGVDEALRRISTPARPDRSWAHAA